MGNTRAIKRRIKSIKNTSKITKAMEVVSATKMHKAHDRAMQAIPYAEGLFKLVQEIGYVSDYKHPLMRDVKKIKNVALLIIGPEKGFVGTLLLQLQTNILSLLKELNNSGVKDIFAITVNKKSEDITKHLNLETKYHFINIKDNPTTTEITHIVRGIEEIFENKQCDAVYMIYPHFINAMKQDIIIKRILPISLESNDRETKIKKTSVYDFEPNIKAVLDQLIPEYLETQIYSAILDEIVSEHSARMISMKKATDNALEISKTLQLKYNKSRQMKITQEIIEIISGTL